MTEADNEIQTTPSKKEIRHAKFTEDEDSQLRNLVEQVGSDAWENIAAAMGGKRTKRQLRERWQNYLSPNLVPSYTEAEDCALVALYKQVGPQWAKIAAVIGKKSAISIRNRYRSLQSMKARGLKPDYERMGVGKEIPEVKPVESTVFEDSEFETWECEFDDLF
jgi:hypothetical protein